MGGSGGMSSWTMLLLAGGLVLVLLIGLVVFLLARGKPKYPPHYPPYPPPHQHLPPHGEMPSYPPPPQPGGQPHSPPFGQPPVAGPGEAPPPPGQPLQRMDDRGQGAGGLPVHSQLYPPTAGQESYAASGYHPSPPAQERWRWVGDPSLPNNGFSKTQQRTMAVLGLVFGLILLTSGLIKLFG